MDNKELTIIKSIVRYSGKHGIFYRNGSEQPAKLSYKNTHAMIALHRRNFSNMYSAWKIAILMSHGYWPCDGDTCEYLDGNAKNLSLSNLKVIHFSDDEATVMDYCIDNQLDYRAVSVRMRKEKRIRRSIGGMSSWFYKKEDLKRQCHDLKKIDYEEVRSKKLGPRKNKHFMSFLQQHFLMPTRWDMTLC